MNTFLLFAGLFIGGIVGFIMAACFNISAREDDMEDDDGKV